MYLSDYQKADTVLQHQCLGKPRTFEIAFQFRASSVLVMGFQSCTSCESLVSVSLAFLMSYKMYHIISNIILYWEMIQAATAYKSLISWIFSSHELPSAFDFVLLYTQMLVSHITPKLCWLKELCNSKCFSYSVLCTIKVVIEYLSQLN